MSHQIFPDGANLIAMLQNATSNQLGRTFDLSTIGQSMSEIERKYDVGKDDITADWSRWLAKVASLVNDRAIQKSEMLITFAGIDLYYLVEGHRDDQYNFRYRFGSNQPPNLEVKWQLEKENNESRGEVKLKVGDTKPDNVRALMAVVGTLSKSCHHFCIHQSGNIWNFRTQSALVEVVVYKVGPLEKHSTHVFVEIEPRKYNDAEHALKVISWFEKRLGLEQYRCRESIAEIFGPKS